MVVPEQPISAELQAFIAQHVQSVEQVEILCVLSEEANRGWSVAEVFRKVQSSEKSVSECLKKLAIQGIVFRDSEENHRLRAEKLELAQQLAAAYRDRRVTIIELIYTPASPIEDFAEAFRLKKKE